MAVYCDANATDTVECLLRGILDQQNGYNWDPLTFGVTIFIGFLATALALLAVLQAFLAAGPGRLKASPRAISAWAVNTTTKFDWVDLRPRTTTQVPFIQNIHRLLRKRDFDDLHKSTTTEHPAGWLNILGSVGVTPRNWKACGGELVSLTTDYLPDDVRAAPAKGTVRDIVALAALAGCNHIELVDGWPRATGPKHQLTFREQPSFGTIAVFENLPGDDTYRSNSIPKELITGALGQFNLDGVSYDFKRAKEIIHRIDSWLTRHGGEEIYVELVHIIHDIHKAKVEVRENYWKGVNDKKQRPVRFGSGPSNQDTATRVHRKLSPEEIEELAKELGGIGFDRTRTPRDEGIRDLLVYRGLLLAALCATAPDISCVEGTELGNRIVPLL
ncbi:hypothetical protein K402DRAFT_417401 [Aulographum hederae CBS 113979]|uniref:Uncharacterized protein n=1 Tax=Aulographum hederae CBS 113979 TaxID=1176131 RepID=A0A6G1HC68_9PEZI|nr:hypothetical protein K402DRAFT_417401 [Aulographum hederae CBS 113979]